jgi:hypothetical protein
MTGGGGEGDVCHVRRRGEVGCFGGADLVERDHLEHISVDGMIIIKWSFKKWDGEEGRVLLWLMIRIVGEHLSVR